MNKKIIKPNIPVSIAVYPVRACVRSPGLVVHPSPVVRLVFNYDRLAEVFGGYDRNASFLIGKLGARVFAEHIDIVDDPFIPKAMGSGSFDDDGVATQRRTIVEAGVVNGWFLATYSARKLGMQPTGNGGGAHNLSLTSRKTHAHDDFAAMLKKLGTGLLVTELMGQGVNDLTGDYSRGATGFWVENGVIAHPVEEVTIAGNLLDMFADIVAVGADTLVSGSKTTGSVLIERMTVAGH